MSTTTAAARVCFAEAARRHFRDARLLGEEERWAGADHLYGLSAECALKAVLQRRGLLHLDPRGRPANRQHRQHLPGLWSELRAGASRAIGAADFAELPVSNPFSDWSVEQRYWRTGAVGATAAARHGEAARRCLALLDPAR